MPVNLTVSEFENLVGARACAAGLPADVPCWSAMISFMRENGVETAALQAEAARLAARGETPMLVAADNAPAGIISVADSIKETSPEAIRRLKELGLRVVLLTGDNKAAAEHIGQKAGADEGIAEVLPEDKAAVVKSLQDKGNAVMMVGDGINDAPALVQADVGCAIGSGSDIAIESADIVLMKSDLMDVAKAVNLSRMTIRNIKQNLFWAFFYNTIGIPIAAGVLYPAFHILLSP